MSYMGFRTILHWLR